MDNYYSPDDRIKPLQGSFITITMGDITSPWIILTRLMFTSEGTNNYLKKALKSKKKHL